MAGLTSILAPCCRQAVGGYKVTVFYRKLDDYVLEDNCPEGTWMERLEALAKKGNPPPAKN